MGENQGAESGGLLSALRNIAATLLEAGRTRLDLFANEFEEEKLRALRLLIVAQSMLFCFGVAVVLAVAFLMTAFWEHRLVVLAGFLLLFLVLGVFFLVAFRDAVRRAEKPFAASIAELQEDMRQLKSLTGHDTHA